MQKIIIALLCIILLSCGCGVLFNEDILNEYTSSEVEAIDVVSGNAEIQKSDYNSRATSSYTSHSPINILGNNDFTENNGVIGGSGTINNPYLINGWDINASSQDGITIINTSVYFKIENCYIHDGGVNYDGIVFYNVSNGIIEKNSIIKNRNGIVFRENYYGKQNSENNIIRNNTVNFNNNTGICFEHLTDNYHSGNDISHNNISKNGIGIFLIMSDSNTISYNLFDSNKGYGIDLEMCQGGGEFNLVHHNYFVNNNNNSTQACNYGGLNFWNYTNEGNYWSDYELRYPNATNDGKVWDTPYIIEGWVIAPEFNGTKDHYPLVDSINITPVNISHILENITLNLTLDQHEFLAEENITGKFVLTNYNPIDIFTIDPYIYETNCTLSNCTIEPNLIFKVDELTTQETYYSWDVAAEKINKYSIFTKRFTLSGFDYSKKWSENQFKLPSGKYVMKLNFVIYIDSELYSEIESNLKEFKVINPLQGTENISIHLELSKGEFYTTEPITGTINISNENIFDIKLNNQTGQRVSGCYFNVRSIDNNDAFEGYFYCPFEIAVESEGYLSIDFSLNEFVLLPIITTELNFTELRAGNYLIYSFFFFGNDFDYVSINSNEIRFALLEKIIPGIENITITLDLLKAEFYTDESITGTIKVTNDNTFRIVLSDPFHERLLGAHFEIGSIDDETTYTGLSDHDLYPIEVKSKSYTSINFSIDEYLKYYPYFKEYSLPIGNYSMFCEFNYLFNPEDYNYTPVYSNQVTFRIIDKIIPDIENISISLELTKAEFYVNESITGTIRISNNNLIDILLEDIIFSQRLSGEHFEIKSLENNATYHAIINDLKYPLKVEAQDILTINFDFDKVFGLPLITKDIEYTKLIPGNYSMFAYFYYENFTISVKLRSNIEFFRIIEDKSSPPTAPEPTTGNGFRGISRSLIFYSASALVVVIIIITLTFIAATEVGKYGFFAGIVPLYSKSRKKNLDKNFGYKKGLIFGYILGNPGENYNAIKRVLNLNNGALAYYLRILEKEGVIKSERDGMYKRFYPARGDITKDVLELTEVQKGIYNTIKDHLGISQKEISSYLGIPRQTVNYHIQMMVDARVIRMEREGKRTRCYILEDIS